MKTTCRVKSPMVTTRLLRDEIFEKNFILRGVDNFFLLQINLDVV